MKALIRTDASGQIGGGHMMRCLALANALRDAGHDAAFVMAQTQPDWGHAVTQAGYPLFRLPQAARQPDPDGPAHQLWLSAAWAADAAFTAQALTDTGSDWLIWDHYGLDARWVDAVCRAVPLRGVLAVDDLDDRPLGSDIVLDQTRLDLGARKYPALVSLTGPQFATLRPEFAKLRQTMRRGTRQQGQPVRVLVTLGLADSAGLVPRIAATLARMNGLGADIVMGQHAQTLPEVRAICAQNPQLTLHVDTSNMAALMAHAGLCIGAGGMTSWERCCLGLGTLLVPVADNQLPIAQVLQAAGAAHVLPMEEARDPVLLRQAVDAALVRAPELGAAAFGLCDGRGAARVVDILSGGLRPVTDADAQLLFDWRNQPHIRAVSLSAAPLDWGQHVAWVARASAQEAGQWWVYSEGGRPLGHVNAQPQADGVWRWGFYIGAPDAPKGAGQRMLARALRALLSRPDCTAIVAEVRAENARSIALHQRLGFQQSGTRDGGAILVFSVGECDMDRQFSIRFPKDASQ